MMGSVYTDDLDDEDAFGKYNLPTTEISYAWSSLI